MEEQIFSVAILEGLADRHSKMLDDLWKIENDLRKRFFQMETSIEALTLSVLSGEPLLFVGPPGTAKSRLIRAFCYYVGIDPRASGEKQDRSHVYFEYGKKQDGSPGYFEYLLTPFTEPSELFGYYNISKATIDYVLERDFEGMMQTARVVYLDEVFNASSAILNSLLAFMNERIFHDRGKTVEVKMQCMFGSTNNIPYTSELRAVYDRFLLRCQVNNVTAKPDAISQLLEKGWAETYGYLDDDVLVKGALDDEDKRSVIGPFPDLLNRILKFQKDIRYNATVEELTPESDTQFHRALAQRVYSLRQYGYSEMSNRRLIKMLHVMLVHCIYRSRVGYPQLPTQRQQTKAASKSPQSRYVFGSEQLKLLQYAVDDWDDQVMSILEMSDVQP